MTSQSWFLRLTAVVLGLFLVLYLAAVVSAEGVDAEQFEARVIELVNLERAKQNLPPLKANELLTASAGAYSQSMADHNFYSHIAYDGSTLAQRLRAAGYVNWSSVGENLAVALHTPEYVVAAWMASPTHRANILSAQYREIGIGYVLDPRDTYGPYYHYWTAHFGARYSAYNVIINGEAMSTNSSTVQLYSQAQRWATEMRVSNYADFRDAAWEPFVAERSWMLLPGDGERTVYVQFRSRAGKVIDASDTIIVATGARVVTSSVSESRESWGNSSSAGLAAHLRPVAP